MTLLTIHPDQPRAGARLAGPAHAAPESVQTPALGPGSLRQGGVEAAIERVYDRCGDSLYRFFMVRTSGDTHLSKDLMQQLFLAALKTGRRVPEAELEYWLWTVARRLLATHWRRMKVRAGPAGGGSGGDAGAGWSGTRTLEDAERARDLDARLTTTHLSPGALDDAEARRVLMLAITDLPSDDQTIIFAHYFEGAPQGLIAQRLGISARAVEGRLYRARALLRSKLQRFDDPSA